jgi:hypothetical protein
MRQRNSWFINFIEEGNCAPLCRATATLRQEYCVVAYKKASDGKKFVCEPYSAAFDTPVQGCISKVAVA